MRKIKRKALSCILAGIMACSVAMPYIPEKTVKAEAVKQESSWTFIKSKDSDTAEMKDQTVHLKGDSDVFAVDQDDWSGDFCITTFAKAKTGCVGVMLGVKNSSKPNEEAVVANVNPETGEVRLFQFPDGNNCIDARTIKDLKGKESYKFEVSTEDRKITVKINGLSVYQDFKLENAVSLKGKTGLIAWNSDAQFSDYKVSVITKENNGAYLSDLKVEGGAFEHPYSKELNSYSVTVDHKTDHLKFIPTVEGNGTVTVNGKKAESGKAYAVSLKYGSSVFDFVVTDAEGRKQTTVVNVLRNSNPDDVYSVPTRPQYHYSPQLAWCNDPNGMVYYKGEYHLFYQYYPKDTIWGPMHWGHAVSKDLLHWEELPIALYPEADGGAMFSGCAVVDKNNTSGFFDKEGEGLVVIYTQDNGDQGQEQCLAYSKDKGRTWTKYKGNPILRWEDDVLQDKAFRDPKIFWHEESNQWMMAVAGGPLRIYSSKDLKNWKLESSYGKKIGEGIADVPSNDVTARIYTECPELFSLTADDGTKKWVLSEGGRYYRIGDFVEKQGHWVFQPDEYYQYDELDDQYKKDDRFVMNFGPQSYAAQSYENAPDDRKIMINWASNWDDGYCNNVSDITGKYGYNGFFNLQTQLSAKKIDGHYVLIQQPVQEYQKLRDTEHAVKLEGKTIPKKTTESENLLSGVKAAQYEITAEFEPKAGTTEVGFKLRTSDDGKKETIVKYNTQTKKVIINGDNAGTIPKGQKKGDFVSKALAVEKDGKIKLNIFVDESSVEVYGQEGQVSGALAIFPSAKNTGMEVYSEGGETTANITVYPMKSIWADKMSNSTDPANIYLSTSTASAEYQVGDEIELNAVVTPSKAQQKVTWKVTDNKGEKVKITESKDDVLKLKALKKGTVTVTAVTSNGISRSMELYVDSDLNSNLSDWNVLGGNWKIDANGWTADCADNGFAVSATKVPKDYIFEADAVYHSGAAIGLLFRAQSPKTNNGYVVNIDDPGNGDQGTSRIFTFGSGTGDIGKRVTASLRPGQRYHLKLEVKGNHFKFYVNGALILDRIDRKKNYMTGDYVGLYAYNSKVSYQNIKVSPVTVQEPTAAKNLEMYIGNTKNVNLTMEDDAYNTISYRSSDETVASVDENGTVTGKKAGSAEITAKVTLYGRTYEIKTKVFVKTPYVKVTYPTSIYAGKTAKLKAAGVGVSGKVQWSSNKSSVASVSSAGTLSGKKAGTVYITAKIGNYKKTVKISVKKPYIKVTSYKKKVKRKKTYKFKAKAYGTGKSVTWSLSKRSKKYASISKAGTLKIKKKKGTITVYAKSGKVKKTLKVKIR